MEISVSASDFVLVVCTPAYKRKSDSSDPSGVGYEKGVITGELFVKRNQRKFIPVLRKGKWLDSAPSWVLGKNYIDLRGTPYSEDNYQELLRTIYGKRIPPPPLGNPPDFLGSDGGEKDIGKIAWEKQERGSAEKVAYEKAEKETAENVRLEAEELERKRTSGEKQYRERKEKEAREKQSHKAIERAKQENKEQEKAASKTEDDKPVAVKPKSNGQIAYWIGGFALLVLSIVLFSSLNNPSLPLEPIPTNTQPQEISIPNTEAAEPSVTSMPKSTSTPVSTLTSTPLQTEIIDTKGVSMVLVPAGEFTMGNDNGNGDPFDGPVHKLNLTAFYIDKYEVTNEYYQDCADTGVCRAPEQNSSIRKSSYYGNAMFKNYPVTWVDWDMAKTYCEWRGARLLTEAEWEKAARGTDGREFPWDKVGVIIDKTYANYGDLVGDFTAVGSYEKGKSPYGAYDMAGNASEWVADWFSWEYYSLSPYQDPIGPDTGDYHVIRGGGFGSDPAFVRTSSRQWFDTSPSLGALTLGVGIRCARDITP